jgi:hypothetical protein
MRNSLPFVSRALMKSMLQRWLGRLAIGGVTRIRLASFFRGCDRTLNPSSQYSR